MSLERPPGQKLAKQSCLNVFPAKKTKIIILSSFREPINISTAAVIETEDIGTMGKDEQPEVVKQCTFVQSQSSTSSLNVAPRPSLCSRVLGL